MKSIKRVVLGFCMLAAEAALAAPQVDVTIDAAKPGPVINKNIYGQFAEHLGTGIYGGMWVGPESKIPNIKGWRKDVVAALKALHVPVVRWPGGCFADEYHWRDGIGPRDKRPVKINTNWGGVAENNAVGTHEFFGLIELLGADAYVNGNVGTGTPREAAEWVEYMTAEGESTLAQLRAKNGHPKPFKVAFFGIGNESWGCGGNMTPEYYADLYNQYAVFIRTRSGDKPELIASGGDTDWIEALSTKKRIRDYRNGISFHYYTIPTGNWDKKGAATGFGEDQWMSTLKATLYMDSLIAKNAARLEENAPKKKLSLVIDEWGTWYDPTPGSNPGFLQQQNSLRDALVAALNFHIFHAHADRVSMTNIAQMVNVLQAMILTDKDKMVLTPTYYALKMYVPFQDATSLQVKLDDNSQYTLGETSIPAVSATAARGKDGKLYLGLVNTNPKEAVDVTVDVVGAKAISAGGSVLTASAMDAHNTFTQPKAIVPVPFKAKADNGKLVIKLPPKSVAVVALKEY
jgi:alpha-L-arabinofuranosidase